MKHAWCSANCNLLRKAKNVKAITIWQPWATFIAEGKKLIETRTWRTKYRGPLLICAGKHWDKQFSERSRYRFGVAVAVVDLADCRPMTPRDVQDALCDFEPGRYAWMLKNIREIKPFPVRGRQMLFDVEYPPDGGKIEFMCPERKAEK